MADEERVTKGKCHSSIATGPADRRGPRAGASDRKGYKSMNDKLYNIEFGTFLTKPNKIMLTIPKQLFVVESLDALKVAAGEAARNSLFLEIEKVDEDSTSYMFIYQVDNEVYRNLKSIKKENPAIKLSVARAIMEQDILNAFDGYVSIYPANIWYHPMRTVKYAYRGNYDMPSTENESRIVRYKALLLYILIDYPFEKALNREYHIDEKKNPFAAQLVSAESIEQLTQLVANAEDHAIYENIQTVQTRKSRLRTVIIAAVLLLAATNIVNYGVTQNALTVTADNELQGQLQEAQAEIEALQLEADINSATDSGDYTTAAALMTEGGTSNEDIASYMYETNNYNLALQYNPSMLETILQTLYNNEETDRILDLVLDENADENLIRKLRLEQAIVSYNTEKIDSEWLFTEDRHTLTRVAVAYNKNNNVTYAEDVLSKLKTYNYEAEAAYINALVTQSNTKRFLADAQTSLEDAKSLPEEDENRDNRVTEAENSVNTYTAQLTEAESSVTSTKEALAEAWANEN